MATPKLKNTVIKKTITLNIDLSDGKEGKAIFQIDGNDDTGSTAAVSFDGGASYVPMPIVNIVMRGFMDLFPFAFSEEEMAKEHGKERNQGN